MRFGLRWLTMALAGVLLWPGLTRAESAAQVFASGKALLARGDLQGALRSYALAARANPNNPQYRQEYMLVRQTIEMERQLGIEKDPQRWEQLARSLHTFYTSRGVHESALALGREIHGRLQTASSAVMLAETALAMNRPEEAVQPLASLPPDQATPQSQAVLGIALARDGKIDQARQLAELVVAPADAGPGTLYSVARLHGIVGNADEALGLLARCFESVAPSRLDAWKSHAQQMPEFAELASTAGFAQVLQTKSKVPESKCSGGSACAGCPMRGKCQKAQAQAQQAP